jgi:hypothetical protein
VAAVIYHAATTHLTTDTELRARDQPDILNLHIEYLRACERLDITVAVSALRVGAAACTLELKLAQAGKVKAIALATSTNFNVVLGPTAHWGPPLLVPPPDPKPDFGRVLAGKPDNNWMPLRMVGELIPITARLLSLYPRGGFCDQGVCDEWRGFVADNADAGVGKVVERMDGTALAVVVDLVPSMTPDGVGFNTHRMLREARAWAEAHPGRTAVSSSSLAELEGDASTWNNTLVLDIEFTKKLPEEGLRFVFTRAVTRTLPGGRMDLDMIICDEEMEIVCKSHQVILVLDARRKLRGGKKAEQKL